MRNAYYIATFLSYFSREHNWAINNYKYAIFSQ